MPSPSVSFKLSASQLLDKAAELLKTSVTDVFDTIFAMSVTIHKLQEIYESDDEFVAVSVGFVGGISGVVYMYLREPFADALITRLLMSIECGIDEGEMMADALGELGNMIVGPVKSYLSDMGFPCTLTLPLVVRGNGLLADPVGANDRRALVICCGDETIQLELILKPSRKPQGSLCVTDILAGQLAARS